MKYLYVNGCSFSYGSGLGYADYNTDATNKKPSGRYSEIIADHYNLEEINESRRGGSNQRIFRKLISWLIENKEKVKDTLFIIQFTYPNRSERCEAGKWSQLYYNKGRLQDFDIDSEPEDWVEYKYTHEEFDKFKYRIMFSIKNILENLGAKYIFTEADWSYFVLDNYSELRFFSKKKVTYDIDWENYIRKPMFDLVTEGYNTKCNHLNKEGMKLWSDFLIKEIEKRYV